MPTASTSRRSPSSGSSDSLLLAGALLIPIAAGSGARLTRSSLPPRSLRRVPAARRRRLGLGAERRDACCSGRGRRMVVAARRDLSRAPRPSLRVAGAVVGLAVGAVALGGLVGNSALAASEEARQSRDLAQGQEDARLAASWMPWSSDPWLRLGELQLLGGDRDAAGRSLREGISRDAGDWRPGTTSRWPRKARSGALLSRPRSA